MNQRPSMSRRAREGRSLSLATLIVGLALMLLPAPVVLAKDFTVNSTADYADVKPGDGICADSRTPPKCTLRAAIQESNARAGADVIYLQAANYTLTSTLPKITSYITIQGMGAGRTAVYGSWRESQRNPTTGECLGAEFRVLHVRPTGALWLDGVTIRNGQAQASSAGHDKFGGGIYNEGSLEVRSSTVMRNYARDGGGAIFNRGYLYIQDSTLNNNSAYPSSGGGIYNATNGEAWIAYSTINHNKSRYAGGIYNGSSGSGGGTLAITNSTLSSNKATATSTYPSAGGIVNDGTGDAWLKSVTITANSGFLAGGVLGRIYGSGNFHFNNTIIARNTPTGGGIPTVLGR